MWRGTDAPCHLVARLRVATAIQPVARTRRAVGPKPARTRAPAGRGGISRPDWASSTSARKRPLISRATRRGVGPVDGTRVPGQVDDRLGEGSAGRVEPLEPSGEPVDEPEVATRAGRGRPAPRDATGPSGPEFVRLPSFSNDAATGSRKTSVSTSSGLNTRPAPKGGRLGLEQVGHDQPVELLQRPALAAQVGSADGRVLSQHDQAPAACRRPWPRNRADVRADRPPAWADTDSRIGSRARGRVAPSMPSAG